MADLDELADQNIIENRGQNNILHFFARIFPRPCGARKNTTQLAQYPHVLYAKPSNKVYLLFHYYVILPYKVKRTTKIRGRNTL